MKTEISQSFFFFFFFNDDSFIPTEEGTKVSQGREEATLTPSHVKQMKLKEHSNHERGKKMF